MTDGNNFFSNLTNPLSDNEFFSCPIEQFFSTETEKQQDLKQYFDFLENSPPFTEDKINETSYSYDVFAADILPKKFKKSHTEDDNKHIQNDESAFYKVQSENEPDELAEDNAIRPKGTLPQKDTAKEKIHSSATTSSISKNTAIRMQEIEELLMEKILIRIISGNLCIWNGRYYRQLDYQLFAQEVRKLLPQKIQSRISRYNVIKEAFEYMNANSTLQNQFSEKDIVAAKRMIVFHNGLYDAKKNRLLSFDCRYPVIFDINADFLGNEESHENHADKIINMATNNDKEVLKLFYQSIGYIVSQGIDAKKFFVFATAPDSGKSIIGEFIGRLIGDDNIATLSMHDLGGRFAIGSINQKILNYNMDLPDYPLDRNSIQRLKIMTGDNKIDCEAKYVQSKTVENHCKFLFASNHPIRLSYDDDAFYDRMVLIPFLYSIHNEKRDYGLREKLWKDRHLIATKAALAFCQLYNNNYVFPNPKAAEEMKNRWYTPDATNPYYQFWQEECERADGEFLPTDTAFSRFQSFCIKHGILVDDKEKNYFSTKFRNLFHLEKSKKRVKGYSSPVNGFINIKLKA